MISLALLLPAPDFIPPTPPGAIELGLRVPTEGESFAAQWSYAISAALYNAVCCSRRAGKTNGAIARAILVLARANTCVHYVNLVRRNARKQFWRPLLTYLRKLGWKEGKLSRGADFSADENDMILRTRWGSFLQAMSCDSTAGTKAVQGDRSDLFMIDECHLPNDDVLELLVQVAEPMLGDTGGQLDLLGLPPEAEPTFFSEALDNEDWARFHWTQFDHDFPRPREKKWASVKEQYRRRHMEIDVVEATNDNGQLVLVLGPNTHPIVARQAFGKRVRDPAKIAYEYQPGRNDYDPAEVDFARGQWRTGWGIDIGFSDHDAIVVGKQDLEHAQRRVLVAWEWKHNHLDVFVLADVVRAVKEVFPPNVVTGDHGGHGATKTMASLETVLRTVIHGKPGDVMLSVGFVNDGFRGARLQLPTQDLYTGLILAAARRIFAQEPERLALVEKALGPCPCEVCTKLAAKAGGPRGTSLAAEATKVTKSMNPRTRKLEINKRGFHSDKTEALRYMDEGLRRPPLDPAPAPPPSDPDQRRHDEITKALLERERRKKVAPWRRGAGR